MRLALGDQDRRWFRWWAAGLLVLCLAWLGAAPLFDVDEGAFSEATREMLASGDWGHTTLNGEPRFDKPILVYWFQAASVAVFGLHEWSLRLPSALAMWVWCLATAWFVWPRWGREAALAAKPGRPLTSGSRSSRALDTSAECTSTRAR